MKNKIALQSENQARIFDGIFNQQPNYHLYEWNKSYINRIKRSLLKRNYKGKSLLDIGAGSAYVTVEMAKLGLKIVALDISKAALKNIAQYCKQFKLKNVKMVHASAEKLPLKNNSVDYIVANAVLEHIAYESEAIAEWKRVLKPGGRMMVTVPLDLKYVWFFFWPVNMIRDKQVGHLRRYTLSDLKSKFKLKIVTYYYTGHIIKACWVIFSALTKFHQFDKLAEEIDDHYRQNHYGASNIVVVFEK